jgi:hypothetical protein
VKAAPRSVAAMQWQRRVVVLSAPSAVDAALQEQQQMVAFWAGAAERDVDIVQIVGDSLIGAADPASTVRARFGLPPDRFMVVLVGKDGHVALRSNRPVSAATLAARIDAMPIRKAEMAAHPGGYLHPTRAQFTGSWRLIDIEINRQGSADTAPDPFFEPGSNGLIVYDPSGWMSVQISGPHRVSWEIPESRPAATLDQNMRLKAAAYDSYYAYFGTWDYDDINAVMTHHVKSSVIPAEVGLDYSQQVSVEGNRLIFIRQTRENGLQFTHRKIWERIPSP